MKFDWIGFLGDEVEDPIFGEDEDDEVAKEGLKVGFSLSLERDRGVDWRRGREERRAKGQYRSELIDRR